MFSILSNLFGNFASELPILLISLPILLFSLSFHESAHAYAAKRMGDPTAYNLGRITLNPLSHIDPAGFLCMIFFRFGWAKPVPINARNFKKPKWGMALTAIAGPLSNMLFGAIGAIAAGILFYLSGFIIPAYAPEIADFEYYEAICSVLTDLATYFGLINFIYAFFNLIPLPPFDGSRFFFVFLPPKWYFGIMKYERYIMFGILILLMLSSRFLGFSPFSFLAEQAYVLIANGAMILSDLLVYAIMLLF